MTNTIISLLLLINRKICRSSIIKSRKKNFEFYFSEKIKFLYNYYGTN